MNNFQEPSSWCQLLEYMALNERGGELFKKDFGKLLSLEWKMLEYMALNERGGELFKKDFRKLLTLEWKYFERTLIKDSVFPKQTAKAQSWKNNRLF